jgi:flavin-dependent dehydrogenase
MNDESARCVVLGAGPAGCAAAFVRARPGRPPVLIERTLRARPRPCGGFLRAEAAQTLASLGVDVSALGAQRLHRLRVSRGRSTLEAELPDDGWGLSRDALDAALQEAAARSGALLQRGRRAAIGQVGDGRRGFTLRLDGRDPDEPPALLHTDTLLLATGKSDLAPLARRPRHAPEPLVGLQARLRLAPEAARVLAGTVELVLLNGPGEAGYAGLQPVEDGLANLCLLTRRSPARPGLPALLAALQHDAPRLAALLDGATWLDAVPQAIARVPYGHVHVLAADDPPGLWRLGDQGAVIASFSGAGLAIALHSGQWAADDLLAGRSAADYHRRLRTAVATPVARAQALYRLGHSRTGQAALWALLSGWPGALRLAAAHTRIP